MNNEIESTNQTKTLTDKELFYNIWTKPREVFKYINEKPFDKYVKILLVLAGISRALDRASMKDMGDNMSLWGILGISIVVGGLLGWISYYIYASLLSWTGGWLDGQGDTNALLRILSYAMIPSIVAMLFLIPQIAIYGNEIFKAEGDIISAGLIPNIVVYGFMIIQIILGIWTMVLCVIGVSEVQKFSIGKAILNILLPVLVFIIPIFILVFIFMAN